jgi:hypothetical protein
MTLWLLQVTLDSGGIYGFTRILSPLRLPAPPSRLFLEVIESLFLLGATTKNVRLNLRFINNNEN